VGIRGIFEIEKQRRQLLDDSELVYMGHIFSKYFETSWNISENFHQCTKEICLLISLKNFSIRNLGNLQSMDIYLRIYV